MVVGRSTTLCRREPLSAPSAATATKRMAPFMTKGELLQAATGVSAHELESDVRDAGPPDAAKSEHLPAQVARVFRSRWLPPLLGCCVYVVVGAFAFGSPVQILSNNHLPGGAVGDPVQFTWFLTAPIDAIVYGHHGLSSFFSTPLLNYPAGANLATNTSAPFCAGSSQAEIIWR